MTIVVTGAEGFLGRRVVSALAADGRTVLAVDRVPHVGEAIRGVTYHQADLADPSSLFPSSTIRHGPFTLVHLAWDMRRHLGYSVQADQILQFARLLERWSDSGMVRLVGMGSAEEYGAACGVIHESNGPSFPLSPYGWAKRAAHDLAQSWSRRTGLSVAWLRPFIVYGPGQRGDMLIPHAVECARTRRPAKFTDGLQKRDFVYIDDVVDAIVRALTVGASGMNVCNIACGEPVTVADVLHAIAGHFDAAALFELGAKARRAGEPDVQVASTDVAREVLGWRPTVSWREGIRRTCLDAETRDAAGSTGTRSP